MKWELYFIGHNIKAERQTALFLTKSGPEIFRLAIDLCAPSKPIEKNFTEITKLIQEHLSPKRNEKMERYNFAKAEQKQNESISDFVARLRDLALYCNYENLNEALCDRFVCGVADRDTRVALFTEKELTFDKAVEIASTRETAVKNAQSVHKQANTYIQHMQPRGNHQQQQRRNFQKPSTSYQSSSSTTEKKPSNNSNNAKVSQSYCYCCGLNNHVTKDCRRRSNAVCTFCQKTGHLEKVCIKKHGKNSIPNFNNQRQRFSENNSQNMHLLRNKQQKAQVPSIVNDNDNSNSPNFNTDFYSLKTKDLFWNELVAEPQYVNIQINNKPYTMEVDTGSYISAISEEDYRKYFNNIQLFPCEFVLTFYGGKTTQPLGKLANVEVKINDKNKNLNIYVVSGRGPMLLGRQWLKAFNLWPIESLVNIGNTTVHNLRSETIKQRTLEKFPLLFSKTQGCYKGRKVHLEFKENYKPVQMKPHHAPFALMPKISKELERLVNLGNLEKVECSKWATPIIPVLKKNGEVRICGNFKLTVNPQLIIKRHPIPLKEKIFNTLRVGKKWSQIDLTHAFMQLSLDDESKEAATIITHEGLYRYTKLAEGIASSPAECQKIIEDILKNIKHTEIYIDNIYCTGTTDEEHVDVLNTVFERLENAGLRVNVEKCDFFKDEIEVLGFTINNRGLQPSESKIKAITHAPVPKTLKGLEAFLGLVNFYERFLENRADYIKPLYDACKNKTLNWNKTCQQSFDWVKKQITSENILTLFNPEEQLVLACDASNYGLSAILSHRFKNGDERPIAFASKIIPKSERHRAIIDKEAAAIVFGFKKFYQYIYGNRIILKTDHEPLKFIFGNKNISTMVQSRLQRWAYFLSGFQYDIEIVKSKANGNCDALSRLPIDDSTLVFETEYTSINFLKEEYPTLNLNAVAKSTSIDKTLKQIINYTQTQWPKTNELSETEKKFHLKRYELDHENGCLYWGHRLVIPSDLQSSILRSMHSSHLGVIKMKHIARSYFWWPNIDTDIEEWLQSCTNCLEARPYPNKTPLTPWIWPSKPWSRIHVDFAQLFDNMFLVIIDAHTKWPIIINMKKDTTARNLIKEIDTIFSDKGFPDHVVSDNGPQLTSDELREYLRKYGIKHTFSAPFYPATNRAAENFVKTFKDKVKKIMKDGHSVEFALNRFLTDYRNTPHCSTGVAPAQLMYNRKLKTRFDVFKVDVRNKVESSQFDQCKFRKGNRKIKLTPGDIVYCKDHRKNSNTNGRVRIVKQISPSMYEVEFDDGFTTKRHINQIVSSNIEPHLKRGELQNFSDSGNSDLENNLKTLRRSPRLAQVRYQN